MIMKPRMTVGKTVQKIIVQVKGIGRTEKTKEDKLILNGCQYAKPILQILIKFIER